MLAGMHLGVVLVALGWLLFLLVVLAHGFRRLLPPYQAAGGRCGSQSLSWSHSIWRARCC